MQTDRSPAQIDALIKIARADYITERCISRQREAMQTLTRSYYQVHEITPAQAVRSSDVELFPKVTKLC